MLNTIISAVTAYLSTNLDYLGFLMAFFAQSKAPKKYRYILDWNYHFGKLFFDFRTNSAYRTCRMDVGPFRHHSAVFWLPTALFQ